MKLLEVVWPSRKVGHWGCALKGHMGTCPSLLPIMKRAGLFHPLTLFHSVLLCLWISWLWTETFETMSPNKPFLLRSLSWVFCSRHRKFVVLLDEQTNKQKPSVNCVYMLITSSNSDTVISRGCSSFSFHWNNLDPHLHCFLSLKANIPST